VILLSKLLYASFFLLAMYFTAGIMIKLMKALFQGRTNFLVPEHFRIANREFHFDRDLMIMLVLYALIGIWAVSGLPTGL
jgi:hypothetical protein